MSEKFHETDVLEIARRVVRRESQALMTLIPQLDSSFERAARMMLACEGHILTCGAGTSNPVAALFAHLLSCCGTLALFIHPVTASTDSRAQVP